MDSNLGGSGFDTICGPRHTVEETSRGITPCTPVQKGDGEEAEMEQEEDVESPLPNLMEMCYFFEQAGIGLNREEVIHIWLALKYLVDNHQLQRVRFWGKVFGTEQNYIIAEVEYKEGEDDEEEDEEVGHLPAEAAARVYEYE